MNKIKLSSQKWNANLYDDKHSYVFKYGEDLLNLLEPKRGQKILDLGCGTGYLTNKIAFNGANVIGIDSSAEMIEKAKKSFPNIYFEVKDAKAFSFDEKFDSVFSNAVLHWIIDNEKVLNCVYNSLKDGGKFVAEFGGKNNVIRIENALRKTLLSFGYEKNASLAVWYFPSVAEYTYLLEKCGFTVNFVSYFKRDTILKDNNITDWLTMFCNPFFEGIKKEDKMKIVDATKENLYTTNFADNRWFVDYIRLRFIASRAETL
jgi:trans-aconitate methyltransferase